MPKLQYARLAFKKNFEIRKLFTIFAAKYSNMKYSIVFNDLPFVPENKQVIYVENQYDERINAVIRKNYDWLKWTFKRANLDFIYLPMFFNDEEIKEKVLYYAPYLTSEIMEKMELRSSYLLGYMSHLENKENIRPSFLYAPKKDNNEWIFQGQTIDIENDDENKVHQWFETIVSEIEEKLAHPQVDYRIADGSKTDELPISQESNGGEPEPSQVQFSLNPNLEEQLKRWANNCHEEIVQEDETNDVLDSEIKRESNVWKKLGRWLKRASNEIVKEEDGNDGETASTLNEIRDEDVIETVEDLERNIERLRLLGIPLAAIVEFVAKYETISRLRITDDLRIFFPEYNDKEVKMGALYKAIYFLFLNHPEGIILQRLEEHHHELVNYYLQTSKKKELSPRMVETINNLEYPGNNNINIVLSRIKSYFKAAIDEHLAKNYYIVGSPGEPYRILFNRGLIIWGDEEE